MRILVLGISGIMGGGLFRELEKDPKNEVWGFVRNKAYLKYFSPSQQCRILSGFDILDDESLFRELQLVHPEVVINCVGLIKHKESADNPLKMLPINSLLPHRLALMGSTLGFRLMQISTDCVFSGRKGMYTEGDLSDAEDLYGKSKYIGEITNAQNSVTLRTSIIGHELNSSHQLLDWFLSRQDEVHGFRRCIYSGLTTIELARVIQDFVLPNLSLNGLYHVSSEPISKFELLRLIAVIYGKSIDIIPNDNLVIDRSLDSSRFYQATNYSAPKWEQMIRTMHEHKK